MCLCYGRIVGILDIIGGHSAHQLVFKPGQIKRFRFIGDNVNWMSSVHDIRLDNKPHMEHAFASAIIVQNIDFGNLRQDSPFLMNHQVNPCKDYVPSPSDLKALKYNYTVLIGRVIENIPYFHQHFKTFLPSNISEPSHENLKVKSKIIPLAVLPKNEQKYQDVVEILDYYEKIVNEISEAGSVNLDNMKVHTGGEQLT